MGELAPDTNVFIHFHFFRGCPWHELVEGPVETIFVPFTVIQELDELKVHPDDYISDRAAKVLKHIEELHGGENPPDWNFRLEVGPELSMDALEGRGLNPSSNDERILAELEARAEIVGDPPVLVTSDLSCKLRAQGVDLPVVEPPTSWSRERKNKKDRRIEELETELEKHVLAAPELEIEIGEGDLPHVQEVEIAEDDLAPVSESRIDELVETQKRKLSADIQSGTPFFSLMVEDAEKERYEEECKRYLTEYKEHLRRKSQVAVALAKTVEVQPKMTNSGGAPAKNVDIFLRTNTEVADILLDEDLPETPDPPQKPTPPRPAIAKLADLGNLSQFPMGDHLSGIPSPSAIPPALEGPTVEEPQDHIEVRYWVKSLKHEMEVDLDPFYLRFEDPDEIGNVGFQARLISENHPEPFEEELALVVKVV